MTSAPFETERDVAANVSLRSNLTLARTRRFDRLTHESDRHRWPRGAATLLQFLREGDTLVVNRIDRLARSLRDLQNIVHDLRQRGVTLLAPLPCCLRGRETVNPAH